MKTTHHFKQLALVVTISCFAFSCNNDDDGYSAPEEPQSTTITALASESNDLSILVSALQAAGLDSTLDSEGSFTVFAPTNAAFENFLADNNFSGLSDIPVDVLTQVLLNHVIAGEVFSTSLTTSYGNTLATQNGSGENLSIYIDTSNGVTLNGVSNVSVADVDASNGVIHIVDAVIGLPTIATFATTNSALSILVDALAYADTGNPTVPYIDTVSNPTAGPFTVFAPTNDAFVDLLGELEISALTDLTPAQIDTVLLYHIVGANVQSSQLQTGVVSTLGGDITADATAFTLTDPNDRVSNIITALVDIQAANGVVHVIDKVILNN